jgi:hypothetical protein
MSEERSTKACVGDIFSSYVIIEREESSCVVRMETIADYNNQARRSADERMGGRRCR